MLLPVKKKSAISQERCYFKGVTWSLRGNNCIKVSPGSRNQGAQNFSPPWKNVLKIV